MRTPPTRIESTLARRARPLLLATALIAGALPAAHAADTQAFAIAAAAFRQASSGDDAAAERAAEQFGRLSRSEPLDPVLRAYLGAATAMRARATLLPWKKLRHAEDGLAQIDKALAQLRPAHDLPRYDGVPASLEVRFTAASTFLALPSMFNRGERGARLLADVLASPLFDPAPLPFKGAVWLRAGVEAARAGHAGAARQWLQQVVASGAPQTSAATEALRAL